MFLSAVWELLSQPLCPHSALHTRLSAPVFSRLTHVKKRRRGDISRDRNRGIYIYRSKQTEIMGETDKQTDRQMDGPAGAHAHTCVCVCVRARACTSSFAHLAGCCSG